MAGALTYAAAYIGLIAKAIGPTDRGDQQFALNEAVALAFGIGTGYGKADLPPFTDTRSLASNTSEDIDLAGTLINAFGETVTFARIKVLRIKAHGTNTTNLTIGAASGSVFQGWFGSTTHTMILAPGDQVMLVSLTGKTVASTSPATDLLKVANAAGAIAGYDIDILGSSA